MSCPVSQGNLWCTMRYFKPPANMISWEKSVHRSPMPVELFNSCSSNHNVKSSPRKTEKNYCSDLTPMHPIMVSLGGGSSRVVTPKWCVWLSRCLVAIQIILNQEPVKSNVCKFCLDIWIKGELIQWITSAVGTRVLVPSLYWRFVDYCRKHTNEIMV